MDNNDAASNTAPRRMSRRQATRARRGHAYALPVESMSWAVAKPREAQPALENQDTVLDAFRRTVGAKPKNPIKNEVVEIVAAIDKINFDSLSQPYVTYREMDKEDRQLAAVALSYRKKKDYLRAMRLLFDSMENVDRYVRLDVLRVSTKEHVLKLTVLRVEEYSDEEEKTDQE